ncbi:MAG: Mov34/MPN/PAD-1 family protein [Phycisphaerae bacterium]
MRTKAPKLLIPRQTLAEIEQLCVNTPGTGPAQEVCGFLIGHIKADHFWVSKSLAVNNNAESDLPHRYRIDAQAYMEAERSFELRGLQIVGIFHSHPSADAEPSQLDRDYFFPGWVYLIVGLMSGGLTEHRAFEKLISPAEAIIEVGIQVLDHETPPG